MPEELGAVHFVNKGREIAEATPAVGDNHQPRVGCLDLLQRLEDLGRNHSGLRTVHLIEDYDRIDTARYCADRGRQFALQLKRSALPILQIQAIQFPWRFTWLDDQRLGISEGPAQARSLKMPQRNLWQFFQRASQLEALTIFSAKTDWINALDTQRAQIVYDCAGRAWMEANFCHVVNGQPCFD